MVEVTFRGTIDEVWAELKRVVGVDAICHVSSTELKETLTPGPIKSVDAKPSTETTPKESASSSTMEQIAIIVPKLAKVIGRPKVVELMAKAPYNAKRGTEIPVEHHAAFLKEANALLGV